MLLDMELPIKSVIYCVVGSTLRHAVITNNVQCVADGWWVRPALLGTC